MIPQNPYVNLQRGTVSIDCGRQHLKIALGSIQKIHISKTKRKSLSALIAQILQQEQVYRLNIETRDRGVITVNINPAQRFFCVTLIRIIRRQLTARKA